MTDRNVSSTMHAVVLEACCEPEELRVTSAPVPTPVPGRVLIRVRAFGLNRSELMLRSFEAREPHIHLPRIPGIECVGEVADPSDSSLQIGERVVALMGGMGRSFDGSYAEYALVPAHHVFSIEGLADHLDWGELAAIPETWHTAWGSLFECLRLRGDEHLLIRGGTSALGLAAAQIAHTIGCEVSASTRSAAKAKLLEDTGVVDHAIVDNDGSRAFTQRALAIDEGGFDAVLDLVGAPTLRQSLSLTTPGGRTCMTGLLGSHDDLPAFDPIKDIPNGVALTGFYSNWPEQEGVEAIFRFIEAHDLHPIVAHRYRGLEEVGAAHADMEASRLFGKAVVVL